MRKSSLIVLCFLLTLTMPLLAQSSPTVQVQDDIHAEIVSNGRTVVYNHLYYDGPHWVSDEPVSQLVVSMLIQPIDDEPLKEISIGRLLINGQGRSYATTKRLVERLDRPAYVVDLLLDDIAPSLLQRISGQKVTLELTLLYGVETLESFEVVAEKRPRFKFELEMP